MSANVLKTFVKNFLVNKYKDSEVVKVINHDFYNPYINLETLKDIKVTKIRKDYTEITEFVFTMVTPVKNEAEGIIDFVKSIENQSILPQEVIIVDGGSTDNTVQILKDYNKISKLNLNVISINSKSISEQRNLGIEKSKTEHIVLADAGNILHENYCRNLVGAFEEYPDADLIGAIYYAVNDSCAQYFIYDWEGFNDWDAFLPAGKTMAIKKSLAQSIGGFPEFLSYAGEDALFDLSYRRASKHWVFNVESYVYWDIPTTLEGTIKKFRSYGEGLGENVMGDFQFYESLSLLKRQQIKKTGVLVVDSLFEGYLKGRERRAEIEFEKRSINKLHIIASPYNILNETVLSKVKALIASNNKVIFVSTSREFAEKQFLDFDFTLLEIYDNNEFSVEDIIRRYSYYKDKLVVETLGDIEHEDLVQKINELKELAI